MWVQKQEYFEKNKDKITEYRRRKCAEKKAKISQFEIIFTYSYNNHAIKLLSRCSTNFVGSSTPPTWTMFFKTGVGSVSGMLSELNLGRP